MPQVGDSLGRYTLLRKLASGGMGDIYLAARAGPLGFGPPVALKVLREELASDESFIGMLVDEANISRFLNHQNVVSVLDFGEHGGTYFIAMEYVQGITLQRLMDGLRDRGRKVDTALALYVATELCRALKYAHTRKNHAGEPLNIVHRDVTPGNVLLSIQGEVKLTDFGIARARGRSQKTQAGVLKGKFGYMAPEMVRYEEIDARADIFCAGVVIYEMVAGQHPVHGASIIDAIERFEEKRIEPPSRYNPDVHKALDIILMRALEPRPEARWASAAALGTALQDLALQTEASRRDLGGGANRLAGVIRELSPESCGPPVPKALAQRLLAEARARESMVPAPAAPSPAQAPFNVPKAPSVAARAPSAHHPEAEAPTPQMAANGSARQGPPAAATAPFEIRPTVGPQRGNGGRSREVAELPTAQALPAFDDEDGPTMIPGISGPGTSVDDFATQEGLHPVSAEMQYERPTDASVAFAAGLHLDELGAASTVNVGADSPVPSHRGPSGIATVNLDGIDDPLFEIDDAIEPKPDGSVGFKDSNTDRNSVPVEDDDPASSDATIPVGTVSKEELDAYLKAAAASLDGGPEVAFPDVSESDPPTDSDDKTVATGMALPDWGSLGDAADLGGVRIAKEEDTSRDRPLFEEGQLPDLPGGPPPAYDDDATAFSAPPPEMRPQSAGDSDSPTVIPESIRLDPVAADVEQGADATLLDQITSDDIERAKREYQEGRLSLDMSDVPADDDEATRIRPESGIALGNSVPPPAGSAVEALNPVARQLTGPLRIKVGSDGHAAIAGDPHGQRLHQPVTPLDEDRTDAMLGAPPQQSVGNDTNKWMAGQIGAEALSWKDDDAARRAVETRNAGPRGAAPSPAPAGGALTSDQAAGVGFSPPPAGLRFLDGAPAPPMPMPLSPQAAIAQTYIPGQLPPAPAVPPPGMPRQPAPIAPIAAPQPQRKTSTGLIALALALFALVGGGIVVLTTDVLWATLTLNTQPQGAIVVLDGEVLPAKTPVSVSVKPHVDHTIEFQLTGFPPKRLDAPVTVGFRASLEMSVAFDQPKRVVDITPVSGRVFVNDTQVGLGASVSLPRLDVKGKVKIHVEATGYETWTRTFENAAAVPSAIDVPLKKKN